MFSLEHNQWRAIAMAFLIVTGTLAIVSMPLPGDSHTGVASATSGEYKIDENVTIYKNGNDVTNKGSWDEFGLESTDTSIRLTPGSDHNSGGKYYVEFNIPDPRYDREGGGGYVRIWIGTLLIGENSMTVASGNGGYDLGLLRTSSQTSIKPEENNVLIKFTEEDDGTQIIRLKTWRKGTEEPKSWDHTHELQAWFGHGIGDLSVYKLNEGWTLDLTGTIETNAENRDADDDITGTVVDQYSNPVSGAAVEAYGIPTSQLPDGKTADEFFNDITNLKPPNFKEARDFKSFSESADGTFPLVHSPSDWGRTGWTDAIDLAEPKTIRKANEDFYVSAWDPSASSFTDIIDPIYDAFPGQPVEDKTINIYEVDASGSSLTNDPVRSVTTPDNSRFASGDAHEVKVDGLPEGFYRVEVESSGVSYPIAVTPDGGFGSLLSTLQTRARENLDKIPSNVEEVKQLTEDGTLGRYTTVADQNGEFAINVDSGVEVVALQAVKAHADNPVDLQSDTDFVTQTYNSIDSAEDFNYGVAFTTSPTRTSVPGSVTLETTRISSRQLKQCDPSIFGEEVCSVADQLNLNQTVEETVDQIEDSLSELEGYFLELIATLGGLDQSKVDAYLDDSQFSELPSEDDLADLNRQELREEIRYATDAITSDLGVDIEPDPIDNSQLVETVVDLIDEADDQNVVAGYLDSSQFDTLPSRSDLEELTRADLIIEMNAASTALGSAALPDTPVEPSLGPYVDRLVSLLRTVDGSREITDDYLAQSQFDDVPAREDLQSLDADALTLELNAATQAVNSADRISAPEPPGGPELAGGQLNVDIPIPSNIDQEQIAVEIEWQDGSVEVIDKQFFSLDRSLIGTSTVSVSDYPLEERADGRALADVVVRTSNQNGRNVQRVPVTNPAFGGDIPRIDAVDVSTTRPGPSQWVSMELRPRDGSGYKELKTVDVYDPDGELLEITRNGESARFLTNGAGTYRVRMRYESQTGDIFRKSFGLRAGEGAISGPPTIRLSRDTGGIFAIAGSGFSSVEVGDSQNVNPLELAGILPGDERTPGEVYLMPGNVQNSDETTFSLSVLRGEDGRQVREHMGVTIPNVKLSEEAIVYRQETQPITREGETRYGEVSVDEEGATGEIATYTTADGTVSTTVSRDPSIVESVIHDVRVLSPVDFDSLLSVSTTGVLAGV